MSQLWSNIAPQIMPLASMRHTCTNEMQSMDGIARRHSLHQNMRVSCEHV